MNGKYLERIEKAFGQNRIIEHTVNLLSMDGTDEYGTSTDKVSLLTIDQYRKYRGKFLVKIWIIGGGLLLRVLQRQEIIPVVFCALVLVVM